MRQQRHEHSILWISFEWQQNSKRSVVTWHCWWFFVATVASLWSICHHRSSKTQWNQQRPTEQLQPVPESFLSLCELRLGAHSSKISYMARTHKDERLPTACLLDHENSGEEVFLEIDFFARAFAQRYSVSQKATFMAHLNYRINAVKSSQSISHCIICNLRAGSQKQMAWWWEDNS